MSLLTNCQIEATIAGMERTVQGKALQGDAAAVWRGLRKIDAYRKELADRLAAGENPGAEIQNHNYNC